MMFRKYTFFLLTFCGYIPNSIAIVHDFYWRDYISGEIPYDALEGAPGRYVGQIHTVNSLTVATIYPYNGTAISVMSTGHKAFADKFIKILCAPDLTRFYWESVDFGKAHDVQLKDAIRGGFESGVHLFIGKTIDDSEWKIGHVIPIEFSSKGLWVWTHNGGSTRYFKIEILKYNTTVVVNSGTAICDC